MCSCCKAGLLVRYNHKPASWGEGYILLPCSTPKEANLYLENRRCARLRQGRGGPLCCTSLPKGVELPNAFLGHHKAPETQGTWTCTFLVGEGQAQPPARGCLLAKTSNRCTQPFQRCRLLFCSDWSRGPGGEGESKRLTARAELVKLLQCLAPGCWCPCTCGLGTCGRQTGYLWCRQGACRGQQW